MKDGVEEKYSYIFKHANEGILVAQDGRLKLFNLKFCKVTGFSEKEMKDKLFIEFIHKDDIRKLRSSGAEIYQDMVFGYYQKRLKGDEAPEVYSFRIVAKNGDIKWVETHVIGINWAGKPATLSFFSDITERKQMEATIRQLAYHDTLTGLPNRSLFNDRIKMALAQARRNKQKLAVLMLDLDKFKLVNDTLGHDVGDQLLKAVASRLNSLLRESDTIGRMGGDEFMILLSDINSQEDAIRVADKILQSFKLPFEFDRHKLHVTTSIGISVYPKNGKKASTLLKNADKAMYNSKASGRNNWQLFSINIDNGSKRAN